MNLVAIGIKALQAVGPVTAALPEFKALFDQFIRLVKGDEDQATLKKAYEEILAENTGGHQRLQEMLRRTEASTLTSTTSKPDAEATATDLSGKAAPSNPAKG